MMDEYFAVPISPSNKCAMAQMDALLAREGIERDRNLTRVCATIYVEREGQKGILIGKGGDMIKHIGSDARRDLERLFGTKVYLTLDVKVKRGWRNDEDQIKRFGYSADE